LTIRLGDGRDALPRNPRQDVRWLTSGVAPLIVYGFRRVRRRTATDAFQTCDAGRAGVQLPSEAGTPDLTIGPAAADRAGASASLVCADGRVARSYGEEPGAGEGVLGLRRGFVETGEQNLLMSLWPISDEFTVQIMSDFYDAAHQSGNAPEAFAKVQGDQQLNYSRNRAPKSERARPLQNPFIRF